jgi:thiosulfate dehydrogenase
MLGRMFATGAVLLVGCGKVSPVRTVDIRVPSREVDSDTVDASVVPPDSAMPAGPMGRAMRHGRELLLHTHDSLPLLAPSNLRCVSCHLDEGRRVDAAPLIGTYARYPRFVERVGAVVTIEERINYCFTRSLAGRRLPASSREMQDIVSYLAFLSTDVPTGSHVRGEGLPRMPRLTADTGRGGQLFVSTCVRCHGATGQGQVVPASGRDGSARLFAPALWGPRSFSIGAGMARLERAAAFIRAAMPYDQPGTLTDQQAYDVAAYVLSHPRPDLPGKAHDWPAGSAPGDVPYATHGHAAFHPPPVIRRVGDTAEMMVPPPRPAHQGVSGSTHAWRASSDRRRSRA